MFVIVKSDTYRYPVTFTTPAEDGSGHEENSFTAVFKRLTEDELQKYAERAVKGKINDRDFAKDVLVGWEDVADESGNPVPFTLPMRDRLLNMVGFGRAVSRAFYASLEDAPRKNV